MDRIILHSDMNNYFASVECIYDKELVSVPMAVCGDPATRHGIVLAKNGLAKELGIMTGESVFSAKQKVPSLKVVNADYSKYILYAKKARAIYSEYSNDVIPYGLDEAWIDLTDKISSFEKAKEIADEIRERIKNELNLTVSIGVSYNYVFSKLASDRKKPDATTVITGNELKTVIWNIPAFEMLFVGPATRRKLTRMNVLTIGDLAIANIKQLQKAFGKNGINLWQFANGDDSSFNPKVAEDNPFKSMGNTITTPKDLTNEIDILSLIYVLSKTVSVRLKKHLLKAKCISVQFKYSDFKTINRQITLAVPTDNEGIIYQNAKKLFLDNYQKSNLIRSLGVHVAGLHNNDVEQLSLFNDETESSVDIKDIVINLKNKLGDFNIEKSAMSEDQLIDINNFLEGS